MPQQHSVVSEYFSGQGQVLVSDVVNGLPTGYSILRNIAALSITNDLTSFDHRETSTGQRGIDLRLTQTLDINVNMTMESFTSENIALALYGDVAASASSTGEVLDSPAVLLGKVYSLGFIRTENLVVTDKATGLITYTEGENYRWDDEAGSVYIMTAAEQAAAGGAETIAADDLLIFTFDYAAQVVINAQTQPRKELALRFEGLNTAKSDEPVIVEVFKWNADPLAAFDLYSDEVWQAELAGLALQDPTKLTGSQYYRVMKLPSSA